MFDVEYFSDMKATFFHFNALKLAVIVIGDY